MAKVESCLAKYNLVSATPFKRTPIEENPIEFVRYKAYNALVKFVVQILS